MKHEMDCDLTITDVIVLSDEVEKKEGKEGFI